MRGRSSERPLPHPSPARHVLAEVLFREQTFRTGTGFECQLLMKCCRLRCAHGWASGVVDEANGKARTAGL